MPQLPTWEVGAEEGAAGLETGSPNEEEGSGLVGGEGKSVMAGAGKEAAGLELALREFEYRYPNSIERVLLL